MKRSAFVAVMLSAVVLMALSVRGAAAGGISASGGCDSVTISGNSGHPNTTVNVRVSGFGLGTNGTSDAAGNFSVTTKGGPLAPGTNTIAAASDGLGFSAVVPYVAPDPCTSAGSLSGDSRVEPHAGDRLAIWCNTAQTPPNVDVWGIFNDSTGHPLFKFNFADLVKAGAKGIFKRVEPLGAVFASVDSSGNFYVAWFGGPAGGTGDKDFAKSFTCVFPQ